MDRDGSNLSRARTQISEREATQAGGESQPAEGGAGDDGIIGGSSTNLFGSKQATDTSLYAQHGSKQGSFTGKVDTRCTG